MRAITLALTILASPALAWDLKDMNEHIDQTNFIVGTGCSGTLIDLEEKLILTNHHCVARFMGTKTVSVEAPDGTLSSKMVADHKPIPVHQRVYDGHELVASSSYNTSLVAHDVTLDLALIQMRSDKIPMTRSASLFMGDILRGEIAWVVGNPLGLENTVMRGVVSSTNRFLKVGIHEIPYLQVDAGVTGGNSGGSLYNDKGQLIGVPSAAARGTVVGLAVPISYIMGFLDAFCRSHVYDATAPSYDECINPEDEE